MTGTVRHALDVPAHRAGNDSASTRDVIDATVGCTSFTLSVVRAVRGRSMERRTEASEELLFVLGGHGTLIFDEGALALEPDTGALLGPGARYELDNERDDDLELVSVALHRPEHRRTAAAPARSRPADHEARSATGAHTFRIVFDAEHGCATATQYVGRILVGAPPAHYHLYEEVIYVLDGTGVMHMDDMHTPLRSGSCIHVPARQLHTLENTGPGPMQVLGVFRPEGSPSAAFSPDGTPSHTAEDHVAPSAAA